MESIIFLVSVFLAGILSFFSPCIFPLLPVYAGILLDDQGNSKSFRFFGRDIAWSGLSSVLALAASGGNGAWQGAILTLVYTLGMALPFLVLALASGWIMPYFSKLKPHIILLKKIGGALIILMGLLLMLGQLNALSGILG